MKTIKLLDKHDKRCIDHYLDDLVPLAGDKIFLCNGKYFQVDFRMIFMNSDEVEVIGKVVTY